MQDLSSRIPRSAIVPRSSIRANHRAPLERGCFAGRVAEALADRFEMTLQTNVSSLSSVFERYNRLAGGSVRPAVRALIKTMQARLWQHRNRLIGFEFAEKEIVRYKEDPDGVEAET